MKIAYATCAELPEPDIDESPLLDALRAAGHDAELLAWDDPHDPHEGSAAHAATFDVCLIRATWNYPWAIDEFRAWLERVDAQTTLLNPAGAVRWNLDKKYLLELEAKGVPIIPTVRLQRGDLTKVADIAEDKSWGGVVIKPSISAGSWKTLCFSPDRYDESDVFLAESLAERDTLVQRYMPEVEHGGERALIWIDGQLTHAIEKQPRFGDDDEVVVLGSPPTDRERGYVDRVLSLVDAELLYARVDIIVRDDGEPLLSELELIEPSLFFPYCQAAVDRFVAAVGRLKIPTGNR